MILYVESNFVPEIALGQEGAGPATRLLEQAERGRLDLVYPVLAVVEPFSTVTLRGRERRRLNSLLNDQVRELGRSTPHQDIASVLRPIPVALADIEKREVDLLDATVRRLLLSGRSVALDAAIFDGALDARRRFDLSPQDAIVLAAILSDLSRRPREQEKCFVSKNWKDFRDPGIVAELASFGCVYAESFSAALGIVAGWSDTT